MSNQQLGFTLRIFIPNGDPEGLRIIEKSNWTGQGLVFPRSTYKHVHYRPELNSTGVYILWGPGETKQLPEIYIGEGDGVVDRLNSHVKIKDFWTQAIVFVSKDQSLNKAHVQHLEARMVSLAKDAKLCVLKNDVIPLLPQLSEADASDAESFLADILLCLPIMGLNIFETSFTTSNKGYNLFLKGKGIEAQGTFDTKYFIIRAGSTAVKPKDLFVTELGGILDDLRRTLVENGVLLDIGDKYQFQQDYPFDTPNKAATIILGVPSNGYNEWKDNKGIPLKIIL